jgi:hypothetical protein
VSPNGTRWSSTFSETATRNNSTGVNSYEFSDDSVNFSGVFRVPNPCYTVKGEVVKASDNSYEFLVKAIDSSEENQSCAQVISYRGYNASFQTDEPFELEVLHGNESVETLRHPDLDTAEPEPEPLPEGQNSNPISKLVSWVKNFFSDEPEPVTYQGDELDVEEQGDTVELEER